MCNGKSPFKPDNGHIHHICMDLGLTSRQSLWLLSIVSIAFASFGIVGEIYGVAEHLMMNIFLAMFGIYFSIVQSAQNIITKRKVRYI